jgi:hypothetical protein
MRMEFGKNGCLLSILSRGRELLRYHSGELLPANCAPKPFFYPVKTIEGRDICLNQPEDHPWHCGIWFAFSGVDGTNFWGGPTYVREQGYVNLPNHGKIVHVGWKERHASAALQELLWLENDSTPLLAEQRKISAEKTSEPGGWTLALSTRLKNVTNRNLPITSPGSFGRPDGGYSGLAWRATPEFCRWTDSPHPNGSDARSLGIRTRDASISVSIVQSSPSSQPANRWFARLEPYPLLSCSPMFDATVFLSPGQSLRMDFSITIQQSNPRTKS